MRPKFNFLSSIHNTIQIEKLTAHFRDDTFPWSKMVVAAVFCGILVGNYKRLETVMIRLLPAGWWLKRYRAKKKVVLGSLKERKRKPLKPRVTYFGCIFRKSEKVQGVSKFHFLILYSGVFSFLWNFNRTEFLLSSPLKTQVRSQWDSDKGMVELESKNRYFNMYLLTIKNYTR